VKVEAKGLRVGVPRKFFYDDLTPGVAQALASALVQLEAAGITLATADLPVDVSGNFGDMFVLSTAFFVRDCYEYLEAAIAASLNPFKQPMKTKYLIEQISNPVSRSFWLQFSDPAPGEILAAVKQKGLDQTRRITEFFASSRLDCLFYPGCATTALPITAGDMAGIEAFKGRYNVAPFNGLPACAIPVGLGSNGLPVGAEVLGAPASDRRTLAIAQLLEGIVGQIPSPMLCSMQKTTTRRSSHIRTTS
jgi:indoleacetamide hydrolase